MPKGFLIRRLHDLRPLLTPNSPDLDELGLGRGKGEGRSGCNDVQLGCSDLSSRRNRLWRMKVDDATYPPSATTLPSKPFSDPFIGQRIPPLSSACHTLSPYSSSSDSSNHSLDVLCTSSASLSCSSETFPRYPSSAFVYTAASTSTFSSFASSPNFTSVTSTSSTSLFSTSTVSSTSCCSSFPSLSSAFPSSYNHDRSAPVESSSSAQCVTAINATGPTPSDRNRFKVRRLLEPVPVSSWTELERTNKESQRRSNGQIWIALDNEIRRHSRPKPHDPAAAANKDRRLTEDSLRFLPYSPWIPAPAHSTLKSSDRWKAGSAVVGLVPGCSSAPGNRPKSVDSAGGTLETIENRIGDFICQLCKSQFPDAFRLADHNCSCIRKVEYRCTECNKLFNCPANLASHRRWHKPDPRHSHLQQGTLKPPLRRDSAVRRPRRMAAGGGALEFTGPTLVQRWSNEVC